MNGARYERRFSTRVMQEGYDPQRNTFTQYFGSKELDASLLLIPRVGFLPPDDPRVRGTVAAIEQDLFKDGFVLRYRTESNVDGLPPGEGAFLACTFWLVDAYALQGRRKEAEELFARLLTLRNDVGLLSEEYDPGAKRLVGNFPQAFFPCGPGRGRDDLVAGRRRHASSTSRRAKSGGPSLSGASVESSRRAWLGVAACLCTSLLGLGLARFAYTPLIPALIAAHWFAPGQAVYLGRREYRRLSRGGATRPQCGSVFWACARPCACSCCWPPAACWPAPIRWVSPGSSPGACSPVLPAPG